MKIITDTCAYIQRDDMTVLMKCNRPIPTTIYMDVLNKNIINDENKFEFLEFTRPEEIIFFKEADWIVDYNEVKDLSENDIINLIDNIIEERKNMAIKYNSMLGNPKMENISLMLKCDLLEFKAYSLRNILWFKKGIIKMELPEGIDYPIGLKRDTKLKKLIKTMVNRIQNKPTLD